MNNKCDPNILKMLCSIYGSQGYHLLMKQSAFWRASDTEMTSQGR